MGNMPSCLAPGMNAMGRDSRGFPKPSELTMPGPVPPPPSPAVEPQRPNEHGKQKAKLEYVAALSPSLLLVASLAFALHLVLFEDVSLLIIYLKKSRHIFRICACHIRTIINIMHDLPNKFILTDYNVKCIIAKI